MTMVNSVTDSVLFWSKLSISAWLLCIFARHALHHSYFNWFRPISLDLVKHTLVRMQQQRFAFQMAKCLAQYLATILPSQRRMRGVRRHNSLWRVVVMEYDLVFEV